MKVFLEDFLTVVVFVFFFKVLVALFYVMPLSYESKPQGLKLQMM